MPHLSNLLLRQLEADPRVSGITADSRAVRPGFIFAAIPGTKLDGRSFIADAIQAGAVAILVPAGTVVAEPGQAMIIECADPRRDLALAAARFYDAQPSTAVAVTGTNGKTSTAWFARAIWQQMGTPAAYMGTLGLYAPDRPVRPSLTTPDPVALHAELAQLAKDGVRALAIEASSHGLDQHRLDGLTLQAAAFTNLTRDHLDYHGTMEAYFAAKAALFTRVLPEGAAAVIHAHAAGERNWTEELTTLCLKRRQRVITYGTPDADIGLLARRPVGAAQLLSLSVFGAKCEVVLPLAGSFQAENALAAAGLLIGTGIDPMRAINALANLPAVPGRLQRVGSLNTAPVYVDYAHTPDALETVLNAMRPHVARRLIVVFGAGGDRDPGKRPVMGEVCARLAEVPIVTDDNPRTEDPAKIRAAVLAGMAGRGVEIGDRAEAIRQAVAMLQEGDLLVIAGKGHESGQTIGTETIPFDDAEVARAALRAEGGVPA